MEILEDFWPDLPTDQVYFQMTMISLLGLKKFEVV